MQQVIMTTPPPRSHQVTPKPDPKYIGKDDRFAQEMSMPRNSSPYLATDINMKYVHANPNISIIHSSTLIE